MGQEKIKGHHKSRIAYVYVRQSTQYQVNHNLESQRRQYQLTERAKELGFQDIRVIDEDLGVSGGLGTERAGFKKLVAEISLNKVGIVFGLEVSRFARNNRDLYHLIDLCALFDTLIADQDEIYHPGTPNDRMVLGLKGTMSEVEINLSGYLQSSSEVVKLTFWHRFSC
jgi:DNA invertase Pin-like site-specific DNA recombinase